MTAKGMYAPGRGPLYDWHPFTKLAIAAAAIPLAFLPWTHEPWWLAVPALLIANCALLIAASGKSVLITYCRRLALVLGPIIVSLALVQGFFFPAGERPLFEVGPFTLTREGLDFAATVAMRLVILVAPLMMALTTTHPADLTLALTRAGVPGEIAYVLLAAVLLTPQLQVRGRAIADAQQARGMAISGGLLVRVRAVSPLVRTLMLAALQDAEQRALALDARAFRAEGPKSSLRELHDTPAQRLMRQAFAALAVLCLAVAWLSVGRSPP